MAKRGRKPLPTKILKIRGSWRAELRKDEPDLEVSIPAMPDWLSAEAKREWYRISLILVRRGLLTELDGTVLALYCQAYADYLDALKWCEKMPGLIRAKNGTLIQSPAIGLRNTAWRNVLRAAAEFGMSPGGRSGIALSKGKSKQKKTTPFRIG